MKLVQQHGGLLEEALITRRRIHDAKGATSNAKKSENVHLINDTDIKYRYAELLMYTASVHDEGIWGDGFIS